MNEYHYRLSTNRLLLELGVRNNRLHLTKYGTDGFSWLHPTNRSRLFSITVDGKRYDTTNLALRDFTSDEGAAGAAQYTAHYETRAFSVEQHIKVYTGTGLIETWPVVHNQGKKEIRITRVDAYSFDLDPSDIELNHFTSGWGGEFEPHTVPITKKETLQTRAGRSSNGQHPWFSLRSSHGKALSGSMAWSGNWIFRFEPVGVNCLRISGGVNPWGFEKMLSPGEQFENPPCILTFGADRDDTANQFSQVSRQYWVPANPFASMLPVEWNHWWSYEDVDINETIFLQNLEAAAQMGIEVCTLDTGWFGPSDVGTHWYDYRGDWEWINKKRFPNGIRLLADKAHSLGMRFGLWCEIEGLGKRASLAEAHPDFVATRDGERLGYVCFGNPNVQEWAFSTLSNLIQAPVCDWIKLDFNLDPGAGCNRTDHGHQEGDGLYEHYRGYYRVLERLRGAYPGVILENCSSGGLRIDPGILRQTHMTFLSDPDWPVHDLQIFWGASTMIPPSTCLHWSFCEWRNVNPPPQQNFNPHNPKLTQQQLDYYTRISMLGLFGFSQKLPNLPAWVRNRLIYHTQIYKQQVRHFIREANLYRLTSQPLRSGRGDRWAAFQYSLPEKNEHLLFVFRLPGGEAERRIQLRGLQGKERYSIESLGEEKRFEGLGNALMTDGIIFHNLLEEGSALLWIHPAP